MQRTLDSNNPAFAVTWVHSSTSGSPILHYEVQYRVSGTASWSALSSNPTTTSATLSSLQTGTSYQVRVRAISEIGSGNWSDYVSETTYNGMNKLYLYALCIYVYMLYIDFSLYCKTYLSSKVPEAIGPATVLQSGDPTSPSLNISWSVPPSDLPVLYYGVNYRRNNTRLKWLEYNTTDTIAILNNLQSGTVYEIRIYAVSVLGKGEYRSVYSVTTFKGKKESLVFTVMYT